jgi:hypothetical protein
MTLLSENKSRQFSKGREIDIYGKALEQHPPRSGKGPNTVQNTKQDSLMLCRKASSAVTAQV